MNKINMRFLSGVLMLCFCGISAAYAAPTVKRLGSNTAKIGSNASVVTAPTPSKSSSSSTPQRLGSIRGVGTAGAASANRVSGSISSSKGADRLGIKIGPYVQTGNSIAKGAKAMAPSSTQPSQSSDQPVIPSDFEERVEDLETEMPKKQNRLKLKPDDDWILLEDDEISLNPNALARKQDKLTVGEGLALSDDGELTLDIDFSQFGGNTYTGTYGIAVDESNQVKIDIANPVDGAMYVFKDGQWVILQIRKQWDLDW